MDQHTNLHLDIIHAIFEHFRIPEDAKTLGICSRVCKTWLPIARNHLFSYIHLQLIPNVDDADIVPHTIERNEKWIEWNGYHKPKHANLSIVKEFTISSVDTRTVLTPPILSSTLASLPRLRRLRVHTTRIIAPQSAPDAPVILSSLYQLELRCVPIPPSDFCNLMSLLPHTRKISLICCSLGSPPSTSRTLSIEPPRTLQPLELSITGNEGYHSQWFDLFERSRALNNIRRFRFGFLQSLRDSGQPLDAIKFIAKLINLEGLVWDDTCGLLRHTWPHESEYYTGMTSRIRLFQTQIAPVFAEMKTLRNFSMRPPSSTAHWDLYLRIVKSLPRSLRRLEVYLTQAVLDFDLEAFRLAMAHLANLESVRIVITRIEEDLPVGLFDDYVHRFRAGLPELDARGALEVVWQRYRSDQAEYWRYDVESGFLCLSVTSHNLVDS